MKYIAPEYRNEAVEAKDIITNSFMESTTDNGDGTKNTTITGHLSHLLGGL